MDSDQEVGVQAVPTSAAASSEQERSSQGKAKGRAALWAALGAAVIAGVASVTVALISRSDSPPPGLAGTTNSAHVVAGGNVTVEGGCLVLNGNCVTDNKSSPDDTKSQLRDLAGADRPPSGEAPYMYVVLGTGTEKALFVRDGFGRTSHRVVDSKGNFALQPEGSPVYADCSLSDGWDADPSTTNGGRWLKVRYPEVAGVGAYWMYAGYLTPVGHNGSIPTCSAAQRSQAK